MANLRFSPWHLLGTGFLFVAVIPFITWHISNIPNQTPGLQIFDSDPSCAKANLLATDSAQSGACTVISAPVTNKRVMTTYNSHNGPHHQYFITINTSLADNPTFQIVGSNVLSYVSVGQPLTVMLFQHQIVMALINGQAVEAVNDPDNTAGTNHFRKIVTGISILIGVIEWALALKMLFLTPSEPSEPT